MERFDIWCIVVAVFVFVAFISVVKMYSDLRKAYVNLVHELIDENRELNRYTNHRLVNCIDGIININDSLVGLASERSGELTVDFEEDNEEVD